MKDDQVFYFDPTPSEIKKMFLNPLTLIKKAAQKFIILEKDLVPLIDIDKKLAYSFEND
jgi:hypothetical protein